MSRRIHKTSGRADSVKGESMVMISVSGMIVAETTDVGAVVLKEWASGYFSAFIFWMYCFFKLNKINSKYII